MTSRKPTYMATKDFEDDAFWLDGKVYHLLGSIHSVEFKEPKIEFTMHEYDPQTLETIREVFDGPEWVAACDWIDRHYNLLVLEPVWREDV